MKRVFKFTFSIALLLSLFYPLSVSADDPCKQDPTKLFSSVYDFTYNLDEAGLANVTQKVSLKNLVAECHPAVYELALNTTKLRDVFGNDSFGPLRVTTSIEGKSTKMSMSFNNEVIGLGRTTDFILNYKIESFAQKEGQVWSLVVPRVVTAETITDYLLKLTAPTSFGPLFSVSPKPVNISKDANIINLTFGKDILSSQAVLASFGEGQEISFQIKVPAENKGFFSKQFLLPIPPDTERQQVRISSLDPMPKKITTDDRGNYLAVYNLPAGSYMEIKVKGIVRIFGSEQVKPYAPERKNLDSFKQQSGFVEVNERSIQEKAKELKDLRSIYHFVTTYLSFDSKSLEVGKAYRKGAASLVQKRQTASTTDFVDLFVALARAAGVPTREVYGFSISNDPILKPQFVGEPLNTKNLHIWAQIYDTEKKAWLDVDPTWGALTATDYYGKELSDRFSLFVTDSTDEVNLLYPYTVRKDTAVIAYNPTKSDFTPKVDIILQINQAIAGLPAALDIKLENKTGVTIKEGELDLKTSNVGLINRQKEKITLLPFEKKTLSFKIRGGSPFNETEGTIQAAFNGRSGPDKVNIVAEKEVKVASLFTLGLQQILIFILLGLIFVALITTKLTKKRH